MEWHYEPATLILSTTRLQPEIEAITAWSQMQLTLGLTIDSSRGWRACKHRGG